MSYTIKRLEVVDLQAVLHFISNIFLKFEAPEYSEERSQAFKDHIELSAVLHMQVKSELLWGCFDKNKVSALLHQNPHANPLFCLSIKKY